jgi:hypothetical protein
MNIGGVSMKKPWHIPHSQVRLLERATRSLKNKPPGLP